MASRHSTDFPYNPSDLMRSNEDFSRHSGRSTPENLRHAGFAAMSSSAKSIRRRSFHGRELKREEPDHKPKPSAPVSVVDLGCWAPSQSKGFMKTVKQHAHQQKTRQSSLPEPLLQLPVEDEPSTSYGLEKAGVGHLKSQLRFLRLMSVAAENSDEKESQDSESPRVFVCSVPNSFANDDPQTKKTPHSTYKPRSRQKQDMKDVQNAIHRLSSRLKRMDLDEVLMPASLQDVAGDKACKKDVVAVLAQQQNLGELDQEKSERSCSFQIEAEDSHVMAFAERRTRRSHSHHGVHRRKKCNGPAEQTLSHCLEETIKLDESSHGDGLMHSFSAGDIRSTQHEKATFRHKCNRDLESSADMGSIELEIISSLRKEVCITDGSTVEQVSTLANVDYPAPVLSISQSDAPGSSSYDPVFVNQDSNTAGNLHFSELLLSSSDVCSPSSEDSLQLSDALQDLSGSQPHTKVKTEEPLLKSREVQQAKQTRDQSSQTLDMPERGGCDQNASGNDNSSRFQNSSDHKKALLWIQERDKASQKTAIDVDPTLVLTRFGNVLLSSIPCEGMQMVALEPLFHETIKIVRSFLRMLSSYMLELGKEFFSKEFFDKQRDDDEKRVMHSTTLPNIFFEHQSHIKHGVQAFINEMIYDQFEKPSYCGDNRSADCWILLVEFQCLTTLAPIDAIDPYSDSYNKCFHRLCSTKLQLVQNKLSWLNQWPDHLLRAFLDAMKYVWQAHLIAQASFNAISLLRFVEWSSYDSSVMDVVNYDNSVGEFIRKVQFTISPGFKLHGSMVKCEVYLMPKAHSQPNTELGCSAKNTKIIN